MVTLRIGLHFKPVNVYLKMYSLQLGFSRFHESSELTTPSHIHAISVQTHTHTDIYMYVYMPKGNDNSQNRCKDQIFLNTINHHECNFVNPTKQVL